MKAPNHITGGFVFTGIFCSLFNINVFEKIEYILIIIFFTLLPDIDHTRSTIGKLFYPLAKYISKKYGHRTITHSLIFFVFVLSIIYLITNILKLDFAYFWIIFFALFSHYIFDMMTLQGIPLFYPFYKNPCVIPANQNLRIRTGDLKAEGILFFIFGTSIIFLMPLFKDGFWTNYNKSFNDIEHIYREYAKNKNLLKVKINYTKYGIEKNVNSYLYLATPKEIYLLENKNLTVLNKIPELKILETDFKICDSILKIKKFEFVEISKDSLNKILKYKFFRNLEILSDKNLTLITGLKIQKSNYFKLENLYNLRFKEDKIIIDSSEYFKNKLQFKKSKGKLNAKLKSIESKIKSEQRKIKILKNHNSKIENKINNLNRKLSKSKNDYQRDQALKNLINNKHLQEQIKEIDYTYLEILKGDKIEIQNNLKETFYFQMNKIPTNKITGFIEYLYL